MEKYSTKKIKRVTITWDTIEVVCVEDSGIISTTTLLLDRDTLHEEAVRILQSHNLPDHFNYAVMDDIVFALSIDESGTLLNNYIAICEKGSSKEKASETITDSFPEICFDLCDMRIK